MNSLEFEPNLLTEAVHYLKIGRHQQAEERLQQLLEHTPNDGYLLYLMAMCRYFADDYPGALDFCGEALVNGYSPEECAHFRGEIYLELKQYREAETSFLEALRINPQKAETIASYGYLMFKTGHEKKARLLLQEALRLAPDDEMVLHFNFLVYLAKNNRLEQQKTLQQYIQSANNEVNILAKIGLADLFSGNYSSAKENFRQAFLLEPTNENILGLLKEMEWRTNPFVKPLTWIEKIGGGPVLWLICIPAIGLLILLKLHTFALIITVAYLSICVYSWIIAAIRKFSEKNNQ